MHCRIRDFDCRMATTLIVTSYPHSLVTTIIVASPCNINLSTAAMSKQAAPQDDEASTNSSLASLDKDLQTLNEMNIDSEFNIWSSFRDSFSLQKRASLEVIGNSKRSSGASTAAALVMGQKNDKLNNESLVSITEVDLPTDNIENNLSPAEQKDINQWNARLAREQVFSRYYFPEQWEQREMKTIETFLKLQNPNTATGFMVRLHDA